MKNQDDPARQIAEIVAILDEFAPLDPGETKPLIQRFRDEVEDFKMVMDHCAEVYDHFSGSRISKPNTLPREVISVAEELEQERIDDAIAEAKEEWLAEAAPETPQEDAAPPTVKDCLDELRRVKAENERLNRLVLTKRPETRKLRRVEVGIRDLQRSLETKAAIVAELQTELAALIGANDDDLPSIDEISGIWSDGKVRVDAALSTNQPPSLLAAPEGRKLLAALKAVTEHMDRAGGDANGMPECPWCHREGFEDETAHNSDCELAAAREVIAEAEAALAPLDFPPTRPTPTEAAAQKETER